MVRACSVVVVDMIRSSLDFNYGSSPSVAGMNPIDVNAPVPEMPLKVAVIAGSARRTRRSHAIARWVANEGTVPSVQLDVLDLAEVDLPMLSEPLAAIFGEYEQESTRRWARPSTASTRLCW